MLNQVNGLTIREPQVTPASRLIAALSVEKLIEGNRDMKQILFLALIALLAGCGKGDLRDVVRHKHHCTSETKAERSDFILQCLKNANPKSDEEPEDWIRDCQKMAEETHCPKVKMIITQECISDLGCVWRDRDERVAGS